MKNSKNLILINGYGRSGSTLFESKIQESLENSFAVGELRNIWHRRSSGCLCECEERIKNCSFWNHILKQVALKNDTSFNQLINQSLILSSKIDRIREFYIPFSKKEKKQYSNIIFDIYDEIFKEKDINTIIDSSKNPSFAKLLSTNQDRQKDYNIIYIHLIRNPYDSAYSWKSKKRRYEVIDYRAYLPRHSIIKSSVLWTIMNNQATKFKHNYYLLKYEDFISTPEKYIQEIAYIADLNLTNNKVKKENIKHSVGGNPGKFTKEFKYIKKNRNKALSTIEKKIVTIITYFEKNKYGY